MWFACPFIHGEVVYPPLPTVDGRQLPDFALAVYPYFFENFAEHGLPAIFTLLHFTSREAEVPIEVGPYLHQCLVASGSAAYQDRCGYFRSEARLSPFVYVVRVVVLVVVFLWDCVDLALDLYLEVRVLHHLRVE